MGQSEREANARALSYMPYEQTSAIFFVVAWEQERTLIIEHVCMHANIAKASRRKGFQPELSTISMPLLLAENLALTRCIHDHKLSIVK